MAAIGRGSGTSCFQTSEAKELWDAARSNPLLLTGADFQECFISHRGVASRFPAAPSSLLIRFAAVWRSMIRCGGELKEIAETRCLRWQFRSADHWSPMDD